MHNIKNYFKHKLVESLVNEDMAMTPGRRKQLEKKSDALLAKDDYEGAWDVQDKENDELRSDKVYGLGGKVIDKGAKGLGFVLNRRDPSDRDIQLVQDIMDRIGDHIIGARDDPDYATSFDDISSTETHPVYRRVTKLPKR